MGLRFLLAAFIVGTVMPTVALAAQSQNKKSDQITYQEIGDSYINSFGVIEAQPKADASHATDKKDKKKLDLSIPVLSEHEKRQHIFGLQARNEKQEAGDSLTNEALRVTLNDLDVYYGSGRDQQKTLMNELGCATFFGEAELAYLLAHPSADIQILQKRQALVKELVENEQLFNSLSAILENAKKAESGFFSYWQTTDPVSEQLFKDLYFARAGFKNLNDNAYALETLTRLGNLGTAWKIGGDIVMIVLFNYIMSKAAAAAVRNFAEHDAQGRPVDTLGNPIVIKDSFKDALTMSWEMAKSFLDPREYVKALKNVEPGLIELARQHEEIGRPLDPAILSGAKKVAYGTIGLKAIATSAFLAYKAYVVKGVVAEATQTKDAINYLQTRLISVANIVDACKQVRNIVQNNSTLANGLLHFNDLQDLFNGSATNFAKLIALLQTNTFKDNASFFSLSGKVLAAHRLMSDEKENFAPALAALGEIDACLAAAKLYKKMHKERVRYCFADFVATEKPTLHIEDFWNPFVDHSIVVTNSLELGQGADAAKVILTGSNTGGKSTILKAIMMSLLMSHTFGIAPAKSMKLSPFAFMGSYLRVNDDTALGESKFKAEVMRAKMLVDTMNALPKDQFGFVIIDELFTGTGSEKAANAAYKVADKLAGLENNLYILATHFPLLTELEKDNAGLIKNMKVDIFKDDAGNLIRPFKLEPGVSTSNVANDILNEQITDINFDI